jgi:hypothetical protein
MVTSRKISPHAERHELQDPWREGLIGRAKVNGKQIHEQETVAAPHAGNPTGLQRQLKTRGQPGRGSHQCLEKASKKNRTGQWPSGKLVRSQAVGGGSTPASRTLPLKKAGAKDSISKKNRTAEEKQGNEKIPFVETEPDPWRKIKRLRKLNSRTKTALTLKTRRREKSDSSDCAADRSQKTKSSTKTGTRVNKTSPKQGEQLRSNKSKEEEHIMHTRSKNWFFH